MGIIISKAVWVVNMICVIFPTGSVMRSDACLSMCCFMLGFQTPLPLLSFPYKPFLSSPSPRVILRLRLNFNPDLLFEIECQNQLQSTRLANHTADFEIAFQSQETVPVRFLLLGILLLGLSKH
jgi:hypothetical protein